MNESESDALLIAALNVFRGLLCTGWKSVEDLVNEARRNPQEILADWAQTNWESIVESVVSLGRKVFLEPYGDGADCNSVSSRVWMPNAAATHSVNCIPNAGDKAWDLLRKEYVKFPERGYALDRFAARGADGWHVERSPFDHVIIIILGRDTLFSLSDITFVLHTLSSVP